MYAYLLRMIKLTLMRISDCDNAYNLDSNN